MKCENARLCNKLIISSTITNDGTNIIVNIPQAAFPNQYVGCLVIAQNIPDTATINQPVVITIGSSDTTYPLINKCGTPVTAGSLKTRTRYPFKVVTTTTSANFKLLCGVPCNLNNLQGIPVVTTTAPSTGG